MGWRSLHAAMLFGNTLFACSPAHRDTPGDGMPQPTDASLCGNGIVDPYEECDQGALNGTPQGTCTRQCFPAAGSGGEIEGPFRSLSPLPLPVRAAAEIGGYPFSYAFTDFSDAGLQYAFFNGDGSIRKIVSLKVHSAAIDVTSLAGFHAGGWNGPLWIEQAIPGVGGPWLFWARFDSNDVPTIQGIPFPFADGTRPEFVTFEAGFRPLLVDQSSTGNHDLLISEMIGHDDGTVDTPTTRLASAGASRGRMVAPSVMLEDEIDAAQNPPTTGTGGVYRIVQFYDDTNEFQTIDLRLAPDNDPSSSNGPYQISEFARGSWPYRVVGGTGWVEVCVFGEGNELLHAHLTHPYPMAVITDSGDVYTWQFDHSPGDGELTQPFAHVQPGSIVDFPWHGFSPTDPVTLWVLGPDGSLAYLTDGDNCDVTSPALRPYIAPGTAPWTNAWRTPNAAGVPAFATDSTIHDWF